MPFNFGNDREVIMETIFIFLCLVIVFAFALILLCLAVSMTDDMLLGGKLSELLKRKIDNIK